MSLARGWRRLLPIHPNERGACPLSLLKNLNFTTTTYHLCCTCLIGSVVDPRLRVLGVANLRVADASVMPEIPSGNIDAVVIMIGEAAAEMIAEDHDLRTRAQPVSPAVSPDISPNQVHRG